MFDTNVFTPKSLTALTDMQQAFLKQASEANKKVAVEFLNTARSVTEIYLQQIDSTIKALTR